MTILISAPHKDDIHQAELSKKNFENIDGYIDKDSYHRPDGNTDDEKDDVEYQILERRYAEVPRVFQCIPNIFQFLIHNHSPLHLLSIV